VGPVAAKFLGLRNRRLTVRGRWDRAISYEANFWEDWLATKAFGDVEQFDKRLDPAAPLEDPLVTRRLDELADETITILDVGAGPLTSLGKTYPGKRLQIVPVDALAEEYDRLLAAANVTPPLRTLPCHAERLVEMFDASSFHIAYASNALDHSYDPVTAIKNMLRVVRPGGFVLLAHRRNEAESKSYLGLHQWNFENRDGRFVIWNRSGAHDVTDLLEHEADVHCRDEDGSVECVIAKRHVSSGHP
jgi:SAM-dependent methyltransferase